MNSPAARRLTVYQRVPAGAAGRRLPRWCYFFLVDEANEDVFVPAGFLNEFAQMVYLGTGELVVYDGPVRQIRRRPFVSARAVAESDPRFEGLRQKLLKAFRECSEVVEHFD